MIRLHHGLVVLSLGALTACSALGIGNSGSNSHYAASSPTASAPPPPPQASGSSYAASGQNAASIPMAPSLVRQVQRRLKHDGFYRQGHVDGVWGPMTERAVMSFQQRHQLQATGQIDEPTLQALHVAVPGEGQGGGGSYGGGNSGYGNSGMSGSGNSGMSGSSNNGTSTGATPPYGSGANNSMTAPSGGGNTGTGGGQPR